MKYRNSHWSSQIARGVDPQAIPVPSTTVFYRVRVWTGPSAVREVAARVKNMSGMLRCGFVGCGTERIWFEVAADTQTAAYARAEEILTYVGLRSLSRPLGSTHGVEAWSVS